VRLYDQQKNQVKSACRKWPELSFIIPFISIFLGIASIVYSLSLQESFAGPMGPSYQAQGASGNGSLICEAGERSCGMSQYYKSANENLTLQFLYAWNKIRYLEALRGEDPKVSELMNLVLRQDGMVPDEWKKKLAEGAQGSLIREVSADRDQVVYDTLGSFCFPANPGKGRVVKESAQDCFNRYKKIQSARLIQMQKGIGENLESYAKLQGVQPGVGKNATRDLGGVVRFPEKSQSEKRANVSHIPGFDELQKIHREKVKALNQTLTQDYVNAVNTLPSHPSKEDFILFKEVVVRGEGKHAEKVFVPVTRNCESEAEVEKCECKNNYCYDIGAYEKSVAQHHGQGWAEIKKTMLEEMEQRGELDPMPEEMLLDTVGAVNYLAFIQARGEMIEALNELMEEQGLVPETPTFLSGDTQRPSRGAAAQRALANQNEGADQEQAPPAASGSEWSQRVLQEVQMKNSQKGSEGVAGRSQPRTYSEAVRKEFENPYHPRAKPTKGGRGDRHSDVSVFTAPAVPAQLAIELEF
jgi:hypothetical protein